MDLKNWRHTVEMKFLFLLGLESGKYSFLSNVSSGIELRNFMENWEEFAAKTKNEFVAENFGWE